MILNFFILTSWISTLFLESSLLSVSGQVGLWDVVSSIFRDNEIRGSNLASATVEVIVSGKGTMGKGKKLSFASQ